MSSTALSDLINVRYYTPEDPYHYTVDNRPLTDLNTNIVILAGLIEGLSAGNIFYLEDISVVTNSLVSDSLSLPADGPYIAGQLVTIRINNTNTGPTYLTVNSGNPYPVRGMVGDLQGGELVAGKHYLLSWGNSNEVWELVGSGKGSLQVGDAQQSEHAVNLGQISDGSLNVEFNGVTAGTVSASGVVTAAAGTMANEVINYDQMVNESLNPVFNNVSSLGMLSIVNYQRLQGSITTPTASGWTEVINLNSGTVQYITLNSSGTLAVTGVAPNGYDSKVTLFLKQGGSGNNVVTWPTNTLWPEGVIPVLSTLPGNIDVVTLATFDDGLTWFGFLDGKNMSLSPSSSGTSPVSLCSSTVSDMLAEPNGYIVSSDGTILQWGTANFDTAEGEVALSISFPQAFPNACLGVSCFLSNFAPSDISTYIPQTDSFTTMGAVIFMNSEYGTMPSSFSLQFLAVGY